MFVIQLSNVTIEFSSLCLYLLKHRLAFHYQWCIRWAGTWIVDWTTTGSEN